MSPNGGNHKIICLESRTYLFVYYLREIRTQNLLYRALNKVFFWSFRNDLPPTLAWGTVWVLKWLVLLKEFNNNLLWQHGWYKNIIGKIIQKNQYWPPLSLPMFKLFLQVIKTCIDSWFPKSPKVFKSKFSSQNFWSY